MENPLDTTAHSIKDPSILVKSLSALLADDAVGSVIAAVIPGPPKLVVPRAEALMAGFSGNKPTVVSVFGDESPVSPEFAQIVRGKGACFIRSPDRALRSMVRVTAYGQQRNASGGHAHDLPAKQAALKLPLNGVLAEYQGKAFLPGGIELVVGARRDQPWGPVVMAGLGTMWVEALKEMRLMAPDLSDQAIIAKLGQLRGAASGVIALDVLLVSQQKQPQANRNRNFSWT